jgi:hypothetical protein
MKVERMPKICEVPEIGHIKTVKSVCPAQEIV